MRTPLTLVPSLPVGLLAFAVCLAGLGALLHGCAPADGQVAAQGKQYVHDACGATIYAVEYAGHRYVLARVTRGVGICHAGDCPCRTNGTERIVCP